MERPLYLSNRNVLLLVYCIYAVGVVGHIIDPLMSYMLMLTPYTLFFSGLLIILYTIENKQQLIWLSVTYLITLFLEIIGVKTGLVFGEYTYGNILGPKIFNVPLVVGLNWVLVIWGGILISQKLVKTPLMVALVSGVLAVGFDILLEPIAIYLNYWNWSNIDVPLHNYIAWFIIAFFFAFFYAKYKIKTDSIIPIHYFGVQSFFFLMLNIFFIWL
jgi:putative membrane protein